MCWEGFPRYIVKVEASIRSQEIWDSFKLGQTKALSELSCYSEQGHVFMVKMLGIIYNNLHEVDYGMKSWRVFGRPDPHPWQQYHSGTLISIYRVSVLHSILCKCLS
jgi:hypothetical protein